MPKSRKINEIKLINRLFITYINVIIEKTSTASRKIDYIL